MTIECCRLKHKLERQNVNVYIQTLLFLIFSKIIYRVSAQWHARRQPLSLNQLHLHSSSPSTINLAEGSRWHSKYRRASCGRDRAGSRVCWESRSPLASPQSRGAVSNASSSSFNLTQLLINMTCYYLKVLECTA